ncbi:MAG: hypothetical protein DDT19_02175 [Syntrophomonadaceae bacterium]|nr:hypothetical protein [Bacillota bacterium]
MRPLSKIKELPILPPSGVNLDTKFKVPLPPIPPTPDIGAHEARPALSEVKTLFAPGEPPVIITCPATSRLALGVAVPIPMLPDVSIVGTATEATNPVSSKVKPAVVPIKPVVDGVPSAVVL